MTTLADYAGDRYSQFGEDGMIEEVLARLGNGGAVCVEFGAADGLSCSNTARLWHDEWRAVLIEPDGERFNALVANTTSYPEVTAVSAKVTPTGEMSVDAILSDHNVGAVDVMSIDVDGDDYQIWEQMATRARLVVIEYNRSIPPHVDLRQALLGDNLGASALALVRLGAAKGYGLIGATKTNLFFVDAADAERFTDLGCRLEAIFPAEDLCYAASDYDGRLLMLGGRPPWGVAPDPYLGEVVGDGYNLPLADKDKRWRPPPADVGDLFCSLERLWGRGVLTGPSTDGFNPVDTRPEAHTEARLTGLLDGRRFVAVDVSNVPTSEARLLDWVETVAIPRGYRLWDFPGLLALVPL